MTRGLLVKDAAATPAAERSFGYDAFVSYSHAASGQLAPVIEQRLRVFAKPFWARRSTRIFRDESTLQMTPHLWPTIKEGIDTSKCFILLASPAAADSPWVVQELMYWLRERGQVNLFIVLTEGTIQWSRTAGDFDWTATTALPRQLSRQLTWEPKWEDARPLKQASDLSARNPVLNKIVASLFSAITGRPLDDVIGEDVRQHRRTRFFIGSGLAVTASITGAAIINNAVQLDQKRREAEASITSTIARARAQAGDSGAGNVVMISEMDRLSSIHSSALAVRTEVRWAQLNTINLNHEVAVLSHANAVKQLIVMSDGKAFATATTKEISAWTEDGTKRIANVSVPKQPSRVQIAGDGLLGWVSSDEAVAVWNWRENAEPVFFRFDKPATRAQFEPATGRFATLFKDGTACVATVATGRCGPTIAATSKITDLQLLPGADGLTTVDSNGTIGVWNVETGAAAFTVMPSRVTDADVRNADWRLIADPTGRRALSWPAKPDEGKDISAYRQAYLWDLPARSQKAELITPEPERWNSGNSISSASFSPDGEKIMLVTRQAASLWDAKNGGLVGHLFGHTSYIRNARFSPNSRLVVTASFDKTARVWSVVDGRLLETLGGHIDRVNAAGFTSDGCMIVTVSDDETARLWGLGEKPAMIRLSQGKCSGAETGGGERTLNSGVLSSDGRLVATASNDRRARIWDVETRKLRTAMPRQTQAVLTVDFSPGNRFLAVGEGNLDIARKSSDLIIYDAVTGEKVSNTSVAGRVRTVSYSADGEYLLAAAGNGEGLIYRIDAAGKLGDKIVLPHGSAPITSAVWSNRGARVITTSTDHRACVWTLKQDEAVNVTKDGCVKLTDTVFSAAWSPKDDRFVTVDGDSFVSLWDSKVTADSGFKLVKQFKLEGDQFTTKVAFGPPDKTAVDTIITLRNDGRLTIHELERWRVLYEANEAVRITNFDVSTGGDQLLTVHGDGAAFVAPFWQPADRLRDIAQKLLVRCLTPNQRLLYLGPAFEHIELAGCEDKWRQGVSEGIFRAKPALR